MFINGLKILNIIVILSLLTSYINCSSLMYGVNILTVIFIFKHIILKLNIKGINVVLFTLYCIVFVLIRYYVDLGIRLSSYIIISTLGVYFAYLTKYILNIRKISGYKKEIQIKEVNREYTKFSADKFIITLVIVSLSVYIKSFWTFFLIMLLTYVVEPGIIRRCCGVRRVTATDKEQKE